MKNKEIFLPLLSIVICILLVSSFGATFAWYQYSSNVYLKYDGTSIGNTMLFDIGLRSNVELTEASNYNMVKDENDDSIYWCNGGISKDIASYYLTANGYATNEVNGVTSGAYLTDGQFLLKRAPYYNENYFDNFSRPIAALKRDYSHFDLVFKASKVSGDNISSINSGDIILSNIELDSLGDIKNSIRIHFQNESSNFIFNPSKLEDGKDIVGGLLDLNKDGLYDYNTFTNKEIVYGETETIKYKNSVTTDGIDVGEYDGNSFTSSHKNGVYGIDKNETKFKTSSYLGFDSVVSNKKVVSSIDNSTSIASLSLDIYLEGWDLSFIDKEMNHLFSLNLEFEINE